MAPATVIPATAKTLPSIELPLMAAELPPEVEAEAAPALVSLVAPVVLAVVIMAPDRDIEPEAEAPEVAADEAPVVMADEPDMANDPEPVAAEGLGLDDPIMTPSEMMVLTA
jgi:hypothetical protein